MIDFTHAEPAPGTVVTLDGQSFELVRIDDYTRKDGRPTRLLVWHGACAECGDQFEAKTPFRSSGLVRRCIAHSKAGKPVQGRRGRKVKVEVIPA